MNHLPIDPFRLPKIMQVGVIHCILMMNGETQKDQSLIRIAVILLIPLTVSLQPTVLILNNVAFTALASIDVQYGDARQHAPIKAEFNWPKIYQKGFVLLRNAPFDFSNWKRDGKGKVDSHLIDHNAKVLWDQKVSAVV